MRPNGGNRYWSWHSERSSRDSAPKSSGLRILPPGEAKPLYADLYDKSRNNLIEAKGAGTRNDIRMALGQLADYGRFIDPSPERAVLLLERPRRDLEELLLSQNLHVIWCDGESFTDNGDSRFT
jgi:hypothetical protein